MANSNWIATFVIPIIKKNNQVRSHFRTFKIPKTIADEHAIEDGEDFFIRITSARKTIYEGKTWTSGGLELNTGEAAQQLKQIAETDPTGSFKFSIRRIGEQTFTSP